MKSRLPNPYRQQPVPVRRGRYSRERKSSSIGQLLKLLAIATTGGAVMLASLAGLAFMRSGAQFIEGMQTALTLQPPEEKVDIRTIVVEQVRSVSELTTAVFTMEAVVPTQSDRKLGDYTIGTTNLLYVAYGEVRAGVNLEKLTPTDVVTSAEGTQITLTLPPAEILDTKIDVTRSNVYDYSRGFLSLGPDRAPELQEMAQKEALVKIEQAAREQNILDQANSRAELVVTQLLKSTGFNEVTVKTSVADTSN
ncbi:MAG: Protein of unknown function (DUF4230) [Phormidesmis priestleyi Ana]|uniref:DUF4230 domain-containing protein n=1 Tax=Phormidesmis priestleyi Ana TaxID=1666911 RepID=A0A0P8BKH8_9CYAN|nr:MAG: Protein of unknown function (DUF4230) [Phormidesmis priestleyi Ana]